MTNKVGILILHGVGTQKTDYSREFKQKISEGLNENASRVDYQEVLYSDIFDENSRQRSDYLINTSSKFQVVTRFIRWLLIYVLSDAVSYRSKYKEVHQRISENIKALQNRLPAGSPVIIVAHSMGLMAISDYLYDQQEDKYPELMLEAFDDLSALISFGCNIPLFEMGHDAPKCIKRPASDINNRFFWKNFYSPFDVLGYRIADYYLIRQEPGFDITDDKVYSGGFFTTWNIGSHTGYWKHKKIIKTIISTVNDLL